MKYFASIIPLLTTLLVACPAGAQEKFDPASRAKLAAPYIDEQTFAVVHVDLARIKIDPIMEIPERLLPEEKENIGHAKAAVKQVIDSLLNAGVKEIYILFSLGNPFDPQEMVSFVIPAGAQINVPTVNELSKKEVVFKLSGDVLIGAAKPAGIERLEKTKPDPRPEMTAAFEAAGDTAVQALLLPPKYTKRVIEETMPQLPKDAGGGPSSVVTQGCLWAALSVDFTPSLAARLVIQSKDAPAAQALNKKYADVLQTVAQMPPVRQAVPTFPEAIDQLTPKVEGDRLVLVIDKQLTETGNIIGATLGAALQQARNKARRVQSMNNLKQIGLAMHNYHNANKHFPAAAIYSPDGKPLLSWRVMILPMLEQGYLYDQFHLDEPWDSPNNRKLIDKMPVQYRSPRSKSKEPGRSNYVVPVGPGTAFAGREGTPIKAILDGTAHTIMAVEVDDADAVIWTKPDDLPYDPKKPALELGGMYKDFFIALFCDGTVRVIKLPQPDDALRALFSINGKEPWPDVDK